MTSATSAQSAGGDFAITRETIAGGGVRAVAGDYIAVQTTGQPALGKQSGGEFEVRGGFHVPRPIDSPVVQDIFANGFEP